MFRSPAPESPLATNNQKVWLQALAELSPEEIQQRCQNYDEKHLKNIIAALESVIKLKKTIFDTFKNDVGYPDNEHTLDGIQAYASGKIRQLEESLFGEATANEEFLSNLEALANKYSIIAKFEPKLIAHLVLFNDALSKRFPEPENCHPSP